jgi:hypothetical protein
MRRLVGAVVIGVALLVGIDRVAVLWAQHEVAVTVRDSQRLSSTPKITIHGFPFLTQLVGGDYSDVEAALTDIERRPLTLSHIDVHLRHAHVPFSDVLGNNVDRVPVERIDGTARISYADLTRATGRSLTLRPEGRDSFRVSGGVNVAGRGVAASGIGSVSLDNRQIVVRVHDVTIDGKPAPDALVVAVERALSFTVTVPTLPFDIQLTSVRITSGAVEISVVARNVTLRTIG